MEIGKVSLIIWVFSCLALRFEAGIVIALFESAGMKIMHRKVKKMLSTAELVLQNPSVLRRRMSLRYEKH